MLAIALAAMFAGCGDDQPAAGCSSDSDCPVAARCIVNAGVCVGFGPPVDASVPDLAPTDLSPLD